MNMRNNNCPCCGGSLLRHVRHGGVYWFCTSCWQEVPLLGVNKMPRPDAPAVGSRPPVSVNS